VRLLLLPFRLAWGLVRIFGRLFAILLGLILLIAGLGLTMTIIGAIAGIPLILLGIVLMAASFS